MINACAKAGDIDGAERWLQEIGRRSLTPDGVTYSTLIHACVTKREIARAEKWLEQMQATCPPRGRNSPHTFCYNSVVQALNSCGEFDRAASWVAAARSAGFTLSSA